MASQTKFTERLCSHWPHQENSGLAPNALNLVHQNMRDWKSSWPQTFFPIWERELPIHPAAASSDLQLERVYWDRGILKGKI